MGLARSASALRLPAQCRMPPSRLCVCPCQRHTYATHRDLPDRSRASKEADSAPRKDTHKKPTLNANPLLRRTLPQSPQKGAQETPEPDAKGPAVLADRNPDSMAQKLDPAPSKSIAWERKMIMRSVRRRGRLSRQEVIQRTEREATYKSDYWKTSMKKLAPLARQIAGKTIDEAIVQMDFSRKKNSIFISDFLNKARITAHVERGMGLPDDSPVKKNRIEAERARVGLPSLASQEAQQAMPADSIPSSQPDVARPEVLAPGTEMPQHPSDESVYEADAKATGQNTSSPGANDEPKMRIKGQLGTRVLLKGKIPHNVYDPTTIYIAQAWVNKGTYGVDSMKRARGRIDAHRLPQTSISVVLKEEATRLREDQQRREREAKKKVWVQLPDRPVITQRPYYCW